MPNKEELMKQLEEMGYDASSGRKHRSDRGKVRGPNSKIRSDKGISKGSIPTRSNPLAVYISTRNRLLNQQLTESNPIGVTLDENYIYCLLQRNSTTKTGNYSVVNRGALINRTTKHIQGYEIDIEKYRFNALQSKAENKPIDNKYLSVFKNEIELTCATTWLELFCRLYHIREEDYLLWSYEHWRKDYDIIGEDLLPTQFVFNLKASPGTPEFMPEYSDRVFELEQENIVKITQSKEYQNEKARYRDLLMANEGAKIKNSIMESNSEMTMMQIDKVVRKQLDMKNINKRIDDHMIEWVKERL